MKAELKSLLIFSGPIIIGQISQMLIGVGDVFMASRYSTEAVAAIGVANGFINPIFLMGMGLLMGISPKLAMKRGEGKDVTKYMPELINYTLMVSFGTMALMFLVAKLVPYFQIEPSLVPMIQDYIYIVTWSFFPGFFFIAFREFLQSFEKVLMPNIMSILGVFLNLVFNYLFIYGWEFIPAMGTNGLAYASLGIRIALAIAMIPFLLKYIAGYSCRPKFSKELFLFSLPIGLTWLVEVLAFSLVNILSGVLGVLEAATNNIILSIASTAFMVPLAISSAVSVKVGNAYGANLIDKVKLNLKASMILSVSFMSCTALVFWFAPGLALKIFTTDADVISLGVKILAIVALFQIFDGIQITLAGVLRGMQESRSPSYMIAGGYWLLGIPIGIVLTFKLDYGVIGLWTGLALSLGIVSIGLSWILHKKFKLVSRSNVSLSD